MTKEQEEYSASFQHYLQHIGYLPTSCYSYPRYLKDFLQFTGDVPLVQVEAVHIQRYYEYMSTRPNKNKPGGLSASYIQEHLFALTLFFNWLQELEYIDFNPMSVIHYKKGKRVTRQPLSKQAVQSLFDSCNTLKERVILHLFYSCGLRRGEAVALNSEDIHFKSHLLYVRRGKGAKRRAIPITKKVSEELYAYYVHERIGTQQDSEEQAFILNKTGTRMQGDTYNLLLKNIIKRTAISLETSPHHLRHSIATHLLANNMSIYYVQEFLGHSDIESTMIYAKVNTEQLYQLK